MITFDETYTAAVSAPNVVTDWLLTLTSDGSGEVYLAQGDRNVSGRLYHGLVLDWGSIDETLDIEKCKIKTNDVTITVANTWHNAGGTLGEELVDGTDNYLNHNATIYGWAPGVATADIPIFYRGRLIDVVESDDGTALKLTIEPRRPWDNIQIPQTNSKGIDEPIVYGDYTANASVPGTETDCTSRALWPAPYIGVVAGDVHAVVHAGTIATGRGHFYDKSLNKYIPLLDSAGTGYQDTAVTHDSTVDAIPIDSSFQRVVLSDQFTENAGDDSTQFSNITDDTNYAYVELSVDAGGPATQDKEFWVNMIAPDGDIDSTITVTFDWHVEIDELTLDAADDGVLSIKDDDGNILQSWAIDGDLGQGDTDSGTDESFTIAATETEFKITAHAGIDTGHANTMAATVKVKNLRAELNCSISGSADAEAKLKRLNDSEYFYCGADGPDKTYDGGAATLCEEPHHIYRDLLYRFTGVDPTDAQIQNWDEGPDLDGARDGWDCRLWVNKPTPLADILEELQFEGQFIWQQYTTTSVRVIPLLTTYSSSDVSLEGWEIDELKCGHTSFKNILSDVTYYYNRDPVSDKGLNSYNDPNSRRSDWDFATDENKSEEQLKYMTVAAKVTSLAEIRDEFHGEPRLTIECDIVNPAKSYIEIGDRLAFSNMPREPLGGTFTSTYWLVEKCRREIDRVNIKARQVG